MQNEKRPGLKERAAREMKAFLIIALYLAFVFGGFNVYKRLVLREVGISYFNYGAGLIEAFIIGKLILVGRALGFGTRFEHRPLILVDATDPHWRSSAAIAASSFGYAFSNVSGTLTRRPVTCDSSMSALVTAWPAKWLLLTT